MTAGGTKPRVLLVSHFYPTHGGGVELVAAQIAGRLAGEYGFRWAAARDADRYPPPPGVAVIPLRAWNGIERRTGVPVPLPGPLDVVRLAREVRRSDLVWVHDLLYPANLVAAVAALVMRRRLVVTVHVGAVPYRNPLLRGLVGLAHRAIGRVILPSAARVAFVSERVRDETVGHRSWRRPPVLIRNGFDPTVFRPPADAERAEVRRELDAGTRPLLLFAGRFVERKGLHLIRELAARTPGWRWVLAGRGPIDPGGWAEANVTVVRSASGASLARLFGAADLLVLPSVGEGFPLVVIEALACGTRAIVDPSTAAGDMTAAPWLETEPASGPDAVRAWHDHLEVLLARPAGVADRRALADVAAGHWSWDRTAEAHRFVLRDVLRP